ncbi:MAG: hypothetical protein EB078_13370 [Proteobacteria bacterium]|nr:hypothetical protein [Pseudomonadota bacterium]NDC26114.1 hypothetical protein [Pseudomonadota bacterium]NDD05888.1 hypothetical protein [Pseudomonadota bacterium]NDG27734.1 hypothetical protein [Pseudomonadota bacterium]
MTKIGIHIRKENIKFSSAHMTVFPDGSKEALHGHNYQVELYVELKDSSFKKMISFSRFKDSLRKIAGKWDEKVLIPEHCPFLELTSKSKKEVEFKLCKKRYVLPLDEVVLLPLENISSETLAEHFLNEFMDDFGEKELKKQVAIVTVKIEESRGQGASATHAF